MKLIGLLHAGDNDCLLTTAGIGVYKGKPRLQFLRSGKIHLASREWKVFPVSRKVPMKMGFLKAGTKPGSALCKLDSRAQGVIFKGLHWHRIEC